MENKYRINSIKQTEIYRSIKHQNIAREPIPLEQNCCVQKTNQVTFQHLTMMSLSFVKKYGKSIFRLFSEGG